MPFEATLKAFFRFCGDLLKTIVTGIFKDQKLSSGRKANILIDVILVVPFVGVLIKGDQYICFADFFLMALFSGWCLAKVK